MVAYTGLRPARPLPAPEGIGRREWVDQQHRLDARAARPRARAGRRRASGRCGRRCRSEWGSCCSTEVGVVLGYLGQRVLGQYELVLLDEAVEDRPPRLLFVLPNLGAGGARRSAPTSGEFMTWVALHEVTHAVQFAGVPWLHGHVAGLVRELLEQRRGAARRAAQAAAPEPPRRSRASFGALRQRRPDLDRHQPRRARDARPRPGGDGGDRGPRRARDGRGRAGSAAVAAEAARSARPPAPLAVGALAGWWRGCSGSS